MSKKLVVLAIVLVSPLLLLECGCAGKGEKAKIAVKEGGSVEAASTATRGMKTYVTKYGFSVSYPANWKVEEWPVQQRLVGRPFNLFDNKGNNLEFGLYHYVNEYKMGDINKEEDLAAIKNRIKQLNLIKEIEGDAAVKNMGKNAYVCYGSSNLNFGAKSIVAMIYITEIKDYLIIQEEAALRDGDFESSLRIFIDAMKWITVIK